MGKRADCPVCGISVRLVCHGSGQGVERYVGVHRSMGGRYESDSLCPGSGRWVPGHVGPLTTAAKVALTFLAVLVLI